MTCGCRSPDKVLIAIARYTEREHSGWVVLAALLQDTIDDLVLIMNLTIGKQKDTLLYIMAYIGFENIHNRIINVRSAKIWAEALDLF